MPIYNKPHLTFKEQLNLLQSRGLEVTDEKAALSCLKRIGYYRLSGYLYPFRKLIISVDTKSQPQRSDTFLPGTKFQYAVDLYVFDKKMRLLLLDAIERVEVAVRVEIAYLLGKQDRFAHMNSSLLHTRFVKEINFKTGKTNYSKWLEKLTQVLNRSTEDFVKHYKDKYGLPLPIWVVTELWDFGMLSKFYQGMQIKDKIKIAQQYGINNWQVMESWLRCLNYIRNAVAHHNRLWNSNLIEQPKSPRTGDMKAFDPLIGNTNIQSRIYIILCILLHFMKHINPKSSWPKRLYQLTQTFPTASVVTLADMGFPSDWKQHDFWKMHARNFSTQQTVTAPVLD